MKISKSDSHPTKMIVEATSTDDENFLLGFYKSYLEHNDWVKASEMGYKEVKFWKDFKKVIQND